jgi:hypothetical protein
MSTYVVSDIHGYKSRFDRLLSSVEFNWLEDELYILGDIMDRGPECAEMLKWAVDAPENVHFLMGNHEDMALAVLKHDPNAYTENAIDVNPPSWGWYDVKHFNAWNQPWSWNGGPETMNQLQYETDEYWRKYKLVPWLENLPLYYVVGDWLLVHAGLGFGQVRISEGFYEEGRIEWVKIPKLQEEEFSQHLLWRRTDWLLQENREIPYNVMFGHTPTSTDWMETVRIWSQRLYVRGNPGQIATVMGYKDGNRRVCIDTGRERMAIVKLDDMSVTYGV